MAKSYKGDCFSIVKSLLILHMVKLAFYIYHVSIFGKYAKCAIAYGEKYFLFPALPAERRGANFCGTEF